MTLKTESIQTAFSPNSGVEIDEVIFRSGELIIHLVDASGQADLVFKNAYGHRVLDEQDLLEFWPTCSLSNGWL